MPADSKPDRVPRAALYPRQWLSAHSAEREARSQVRESEQAREERMDDARRTDGGDTKHAVMNGWQLVRVPLQRVSTT